MKKELETINWVMVLAFITTFSFCLTLNSGKLLNSEIMAVSDWKIEINQKQAVEANFKGKQGIVAAASWYDYKLDGIVWSKEHNTCASRTLKRYTMARITNLANGKTVDCYVNDYIEHPDREIDLSSHAFAEIADLKLGLVKVKIEQL